jgi:lactoylglutathione lyase
MSRANSGAPSEGSVRVQVGYAIVFVSDMERSVAFYRDTIGLPLRFQSPAWTEFETGEATLALHRSEATASTNDDPNDLPAGRCRPGLRVSDLDVFHARMVERGVPCLQEPQEVFGARLAQYRDPDGLAVSVGEERRSR